MSSQQSTSRGLGSATKRKAPSSTVTSQDLEAKRIRRTSTSDDEDVEIVRLYSREIDDLVTNLHEMLPHVPRHIIEEQAPELVGKPVALENFIAGHLTKKLPNPRLKDKSKADRPVQRQEDQVLNNLLDVFPNLCPEFLKQKSLEFANQKDVMERWINETIENFSSGLPTRKEYESRIKLQNQASVKEILDMFDEDPKMYFRDQNRTLSAIYKDQAFALLLTEFPHISHSDIRRIFNRNLDHFLPSYKELKKFRGVMVENPEQDYQAPLPAKIDPDLLREVQYARNESKVHKYMRNLETEQKNKLESARKLKLLEDCDCCGNDECLEMFPCPNSHSYCQECIRRASSVAIGDGKTELKCLMHCDQPFSLSVLQAALKPSQFSKWLQKIQAAECEKAALEGMESCPFCPYLVINDTPKEENKIFICHNPDCGIQSCRLCKKASHIPLKCDVIEEDKEVLKRTFIETKLSEKLIRRCYNCQQPYIKLVRQHILHCSLKESLDTNANSFLISLIVKSLLIFLYFRMVVTK